MLARDGYLEIDEVKDIPGYPGTDVLSEEVCGRRMLAEYSM